MKKEKLRNEEGSNIYTGTTVLTQLARWVRKITPVNYTPLIMAPIPKRIKPSGAYYRKIAKEKKEKLDKTIKNNNRVDKMFHQLNNSVKNSFTDGSANNNCSSSNMQMHNENEYYTIFLNKLSKNSEILLNEENKLIQKCGNNSDDVKSLDADFSHDFKIPGTDPADWNINEFTIDYVCKNGYIQNLDSNFSRSKRLSDGSQRFI
ncbi:hypothetical protein ACI65C_013851 [Semiaphis heraclei]